QLARLRSQGVDILKCPRSRAQSPFGLQSRSCCSRLQNLSHCPNCVFQLPEKSEVCLNRAALVCTHETLHTSERSVSLYRPTGGSPSIAGSRIRMRVPTSSS